MGGGGDEPLEDKTSYQKDDIAKTACLTGAAKLAWRQRGDNRERDRKLKHRAGTGGCFYLLFSSFSIQYFN